MEVGSNLAEFVEASDLVTESGDIEAAAAHLDRAEALCREAGRLHDLLDVLCVRVRLLDSDAGGLLAALELYEAGSPFSTRMEARLLLWRLTKDHAHLTEAKRLLDHLVEHAPEKYRESMLKNVRLNREIMEAWEEHCGGE